MRYENVLKILDVLAPAIIGVVVFSLLDSQVNVGLTVGKTSSSIIDPRTFPILVASLLIIISIIRLIFFLMGKEMHFNIKDPLVIFKNPRLFLTIITMILYIVAISLFGYLIPTFCASITFTYLLGKPKWYIALLIATCITLILKFVFIDFLNIPFPTIF